MQPVCIRQKACDASTQGLGHCFGKFLWELILIQSVILFAVFVFLVVRGRPAFVRVFLEIVFHECGDFVGELLSRQNQGRFYSLVDELLLCIAVEHPSWRGVENRPEEPGKFIVFPRAGRGETRDVEKPRQNVVVIRARDEFGKSCFQCLARILRRHFVGVLEVAQEFLRVSAFFPNGVAGVEQGFARVEFTFRRDPEFQHVPGIRFGLLGIRVVAESGRAVHLAVMQKMKLLRVILLIRRRCRSWRIQDFQQFSLGHRRHQREIGILVEQVVYIADDELERFHAGSQEYSIHKDANEGETFFRFERGEFVHGEEFLALIISYYTIFPRGAKYGII